MMSLRRLIPILLALAVVAIACHGGSLIPRQKLESKLALPSTFAGQLPCADCEGIRYHLDLWSNHAFHLQREWLGPGLVRYDIGRWSLDSDRKVLMLETGGEMLLQFEASHPKALRLLDTNGHHITSTLNYTLASKGRLDPMDVTLPLRGELAVDGAKLRFVECLTGRAFVVGEEGEATAARQALIAAESDSVYVTIEGTLHSTTVVVRRFINAWPGESCERSLSDAPLVNTRWRLDRLDRESIRPVPGQRDPYLRLRDGDQGATYEASAGCNQMGGSYARSSESLSFTAGPTTLMACEAPIDALEKQLTDVLSRTRRFHIIGNTLELTDESGTSLALFEALYLK
jgi:copper homeostasis protein (lipoprotein)